VAAIRLLVNTAKKKRRREKRRGTNMGRRSPMSRFSYAGRNIRTRERGQGGVAKSKKRRIVKQYKGFFQARTSAKRAKVRANCEIGSQDFEIGRRAVRER